MLALLEWDIDVDLRVYEDACEEDYVTRYASVDARLEEKGILRG
jgi:hypothetical protein